MKQFVLVIFLLVLYSSSILSQTPDPKSSNVLPNLLDKIELKFDLTGTPKPEDVGFDDRNSSWKLKYELLLSSEKATNDLISKAYVNCKKSAANYQKCTAIANKKLGKQFKKIALFISRGASKRNPLSAEAEREVIIPVKFTPDVIRIFNDAAQSAENPVFLLQIKSKVSAKTSTKKRIKYKTSVSFQYPLKLIKRDGSFEFYNINVFGAAVDINKESDGNFSYSIFKN